MTSSDSREVIAEPRTPKRIQRSRAKGARIPDGAIYVGRGRSAYGRWGNPIRIVPERSERGIKMFRVTGSPMDLHGGPSYVQLETARYFAAKQFESDLLNGNFGDRYPSVEEIRAELAGKDLACWCPLPDRLRSGALDHDACHGAVLLEIAAGFWP